MNHAAPTLLPHHMERNAVDPMRIVAMPPQSRTPVESSASNRELLERLSQSAIFRDYERAFVEATGFPLALSPADNLQLTHHNRAKESPLCALLAKNSKACAACLQTQHELATNTHEEPRTVTCAMGLCESAVPLRMGHKLIGFLRTGEVLLRPVTERQISQAGERCRAWGLKVDTEQLRKVYSRTRVLSKKQYDSMLQLLELFAEHLALVANQLLFRMEHAEDPMITRAREFISTHYSEDLSLSTVAAAVHMSSFYFCKRFKKGTGLSYTNYLGRVRVEKAKLLLLNPHARITEVAFEVGFQSLTHFNRVFRNLTGESPSGYRLSMDHAVAA